MKNNFQNQYQAKCDEILKLLELKYLQNTSLLDELNHIKLSQKHEILFQQYKINSDERIQQFMKQFRNKISNGQAELIQIGLQINEKKQQIQKLKNKESFTEINSQISNEKKNEFIKLQKDYKFEISLNTKIQNHYNKILQQVENTNQMIQQIQNRQETIKKITEEMIGQDKNTSDNKNLQKKYKSMNQKYKDLKQKMVIQVQQNEKIVKQKIDKLVSMQQTIMEQDFYLNKINKQLKIQNTLIKQLMKKQGLLNNDDIKTEKNQLMFQYKKYKFRNRYISKYFSGSQVPTQQNNIPSSRIQSQKFFFQKPIQKKLIPHQIISTIGLTPKKNLEVVNSPPYYQFQFNNKKLDKVELPRLQRANYEDFKYFQTQQIRQKLSTKHSQDDAVYKAINSNIGSQKIQNRQRLIETSNEKQNNKKSKSVQKTHNLYIKKNHKIKHTSNNQIQNLKPLKKKRINSSNSTSSMQNVFEPIRIQKQIHIIHSAKSQQQTLKQQSESQLSNIYPIFTKPVTQIKQIQVPIPKTKKNLPVKIIPKKPQINLLEENSIMLSSVTSQNHRSNRTVQIKQSIPIQKPIIDKQPKIQAPLEIIITPKKKIKREKLKGISESTEDYFKNKIESYSYADFTKAQQQFSVKSIKTKAASQQNLDQIPEFRQQQLGISEDQ